MTLNITLAARWLMLQSSDFRLTRSDTAMPVSDAAQKQVVLHYRKWSGLVCYTGVAKWDTHDTAEWLGQVLTHEGGERTPAEVITKLVAEGNKWLSAVPTPSRRHTFTLIAYVRRIPHVYVISNHQWAGGREYAEPPDKLKVDHFRARGPRCLVTGYAHAVTREQREYLLAALGHGASAEDLRHAVALTSREAATRSQGTVGETCVVAHLLPDGSGEAQVFGNLESAFSPTLITHGMNFATALPGVLREAGETGPHRLVGVTWTANGPMSAMCGAYRALAGQTGTGWPPPPEVEGTS